MESKSEKNYADFLLFRTQILAVASLTCFPLLEKISQSFSLNEAYRESCKSSVCSLLLQQVDRLTKKFPFLSLSPSPYSLMLFFSHSSYPGFPTNSIVLVNTAVHRQTNLCRSCCRKKELLFGSALLKRPNLSEGNVTKIRSRGDDGDDGKDDEIAIRVEVEWMTNQSLPCMW